MAMTERQIPFAWNRNPNRAAERKLKRKVWDATRASKHKFLHLAMDHDTYDQVCLIHLRLGSKSVAETVRILLETGIEEHQKDH